ncbi:MULTISPECIES: globin domain-containing protein [unclassified Staphylococcus]|uniref:globin domain-containing protein n=1 Tax=unclassified Staphylococcus TaxID=91994 RepID=UPI0021D307B1|nr:MULTISPECIES: globin domain-containing protein [unclassified Staphylococcus]UXR70166.1 globin domain-containing protein [Staphylococcus sp. IVB6246]UXR72226.1 globin domain-containing protein [Staphylococcus sp. IVB6240]UXR74535.1 globin domain-containing protein [Staphylococcus sp. IVB6238]UXR76919.1 globin domain-containing protein [Staphylococcus sp. IVB6233]UXR81045.1 globin domain-containing protein [Staphylococcus sp. IVB6218]
MLTQEEKGIILETVPVLKEKGTEITSRFYNRMFNQHPELRNMFNQTNQKKGFQSTALAQSVLAAAVNIDDFTPIVPIVKEVGYKHCALDVREEHYPIVGENLLAAIQDVVGVDENHPIIKTWAKAYGVIADAFISIEKEIYAGMAWEGFKPFKIDKIEEVTHNIKAFTVVSKDQDLSQFVPGQYITVDVESEKLPYRAKRHYSIVDGGKDFITFGVRREVSENHEGEVSTILHDEFKEGDMINLSAPVGGFQVHNVEKPQLFLGSGVGVTPLVSMYRHAAQQGTNVKFINVAASEKDVAFKAELDKITAEAKDAKLHTHLRDAEGYLKAAELKDYLADDTEVYICGGTPFLQSMIQELQELGVDENRIHFETFVPRLSVAV